MTLRPSLSTRISNVSLAGTVLAAVVGAFVGLTRSSLWLDELFTVYFSDPQTGGLAGLIQRATEDVHPPLYYALVYGVRHVVDDAALAGRGLSAVLGCAALIVLYTGTRAELSREARLAVCAFAATSVPWFLAVQEMRSYALCFLLSSGLLVLSLRILRAWQAGETPDWRPHAALWATATCGGLAHLYLTFVAAGALVTLWLLARTPAQRWRMTWLGLTTGAPLLAEVIWQRPHVIARLDQTWFVSSPAFLAEQFAQGASALGGSWLGAWLLRGVVGYAIVLRIRKRFAVPILPNAAVLFLAIAPAIVIGLTLLVSATLQPIFSGRFFQTILPFVWVAFGLAIQACGVSGRAGRWLVAACAVLLLANNAKLYWRHTPQKQEWRASASFVASLQQCRNLRIPVAVLDRPYLSAPEAPQFYGYYLGPMPRPEFLSVSRKSLREGVVDGVWRELAIDRLTGVDACPVLLWSVHHLSVAQVEALAGELAKLAPGWPKARATVRSVRFPHKVLTASDPPGAEAQGEETSAFVLVADRNEGACER